MVGGKREKKKRKKIQKNLQNKSKHKNSKYFSWVSAASILSLAGSNSLPHPTRVASNTALVSGSDVGASQTLILSYSCVLLSPMSTAIRTSVFSLWELSMSSYIFHRHRVCLADHVDLIFSLYSFWEGFGSSSLATLLLGFNCGFISTSACGLSTGICSWSCPGGLGSAPVRARCGGGAGAWVTGVLEAPGTQRSWRLEQQEIIVL